MALSSSPLTATSWRSSKVSFIRKVFAYSGAVSRPHCLPPAADLDPAVLAVGPQPAFDWKKGLSGFGIDSTNTTPQGTPQKGKQPPPMSSEFWRRAMRSSVLGDARPQPDEELHIVPLQLFPDPDMTSPTKALRVMAHDPHIMGLMHVLAPGDDVLVPGDDEMEPGDDEMERLRGHYNFTKMTKSTRVKTEERMDDCLKKSLAAEKLIGDAAEAMLTSVGMAMPKNWRAELCVVHRAHAFSKKVEFKMAHRHMRGENTDMAVIRAHAVDVVLRMAFGKSLGKSELHDCSHWGQWIADTSLYTGATDASIEDLLAARTDLGARVLARFDAALGGGSAASKNKNKVFPRRIGQSKVRVMNKRKKEAGAAAHQVVG